MAKAIKSRNLTQLCLIDVSGWLWLVKELPYMPKPTSDELVLHGPRIFKTRNYLKRLETWLMMYHQTWEQGKAQIFGIAQPGSI